MKTRLTALLAVLILLFTLTPAGPVAAASPVKGEPACVKTWWWSKPNCAGRDMYRHLAGLNLNVSNAEKVRRVRIGMLAAYSPYQAKTKLNAQLNQLMEINYTRVSAGNAACYRAATMAFVRNTAKTGKATKEAVQMYNLVWKAAGKAPLPVPYKAATKLAAKQWGKLANHAAKMAVSKTAYSATLDSFVDCGGAY